MIPISKIIVPKMIIFLIFVLLVENYLGDPSLKKTLLQEASKGVKGLPWRLHIGTFWNLPFMTLSKRLTVKL